MRGDWREIAVGMTVRGPDGRKVGKVVGFGSRVILVRKGLLLPRMVHVPWDDIITVEDGVVTT